MSQDLNTNTCSCLVIFVYWTYENHAFNATPIEMLQQHPLVFAMNHTYCTFRLWRLCTWHHFHILVKARLCCDWKGRAASAQSFPLLYQATIKIPRRDHFISACSRHMGVVHHAHYVRDESHIQHNANWEASTLVPRLGLTFWNDWEWKRQVKCNLNTLRYKQPGIKLVKTTLGTIF